MFVTCMVVVARSAIKYSKMKNEISNNEQVRTEEGTQDNKDISSQSLTREKDASRDVIDSERNWFFIIVNCFKIIKWWLYNAIIEFPS